ncbi:MAG: hypothetical protein ACK5PU_02910, partial [bacterium]
MARLQHLGRGARHHRRVDGHLRLVGDVGQQRAAAAPGFAIRDEQPVPQQRGERPAHHRPLAFKQLGRRHEDGPDGCWDVV